MVKLGIYEKAPSKAKWIQPPAVPIAAFMYIGVSNYIFLKSL